ncbi:putative TBC1 domain family member 10A [Paratrimastix pyriformis]|uniref:TBC1 domain family member 10A n=1 Tax=Paratrimastix pyriformis TaxID=342808 RepID=A0ABQ8UUF2_9EUKA|nr:putative TBC1 domain family member 10A [Paratrimastix pyriformis]
MGSASDTIECDAGGFYLHSEFSGELPTYQQIVYLHEEEKWFHMLKNWPAYSTEPSLRTKTSRRIWRGIPPSLRGEVWYTLSGGAQHHRDHPTLYRDILAKVPQAECNAHIASVGRDARRTFPEHLCFRDQAGLQALSDVLIAVALYCPSVGYVQGMNFIVAALLLHAPPERVFHIVVCMVQSMMDGYFEEGLPQFMADSECMGRCLKTCPLTASLSEHLGRLGVFPLMYTPKFFMSVFLLVLPFPTAMRVFDVLFWEGMEVLFPVGLALVFLGKDHLLKQQQAERAVGVLIRPSGDMATADTLMNTACGPIRGALPAEAVHTLRLQCRAALDCPRKPLAPVPMTRPPGDTELQSPGPVAGPSAEPESPSREPAQPTQEEPGITGERVRTERGDPPPPPDRT